MLTKSDLKNLRNLLKTELKSEIKPIGKRLDKLEIGLTVVRKDVSVLKTDVAAIKQDTTDIKIKVNEFASFTIDALGNILEWTQDIHETIVQEELPARVKNLEDIHPGNRHQVVT